MRSVVRAILCAAMILFVAAAGQAQVFLADLSGPAEDPPNASPGTGSAIVTLNSLAHTMRVQVTFSGLLGTTTASHIHGPTPAPFTGTAGVATTTPTFPGFPLGVTSGTYDNLFDTLADSSYRPAFITANGGTAAGAEAGLFAAIMSGRAYLNIHTGQFLGGEIRGFLVPAAAAVPEPGTLSFLGGLGVGGLLLAARRRRR